MYRDLNDYEILYMVSEDSDINFDILYEKYRPLIKNVVKEYVFKFNKFGYEMEDLMQIGYLTLFKCSKLYNGYNHTLFYTYFKKALIFSLQAEMRTNETLKRETLNNAYSYDININSKELSYVELFPNTREHCYNSEYYNKIINFKNSMPYDMSCIFELYYNGFSFKEISQIMEKNIDTIKRRFYKIRRYAFTHKYLFFL